MTSRLSTESLYFLLFSLPPPKAQESAISAEDFEKAESLSVELDSLQAKVHDKEQQMDSIEESIRIAETAKENMEMHLLETLMGTAITGLGKSTCQRERTADRTNIIVVISHVLLSLY